MLKPRKFKDLEKKLGHRFKDVTLIERALTHASVRGGKADRSDNERLEFIGDRVLGLAIAEVLSAQHPEASEGELARRFNRLVRGEIVRPCRPFHRSGPASDLVGKRSR